MDITYNAFGSFNSHGFTNIMKLSNNNLKFYTAAAASKRRQYSEKEKENANGEKKWEMEWLKVMNKWFLIYA